MGGRIARLIGNQTKGINALESVRSAVPLCGGADYRLRIVASASVREEDRAKRPWGGKWRPYRLRAHDIVGKGTGIEVA